MQAASVLLLVLGRRSAEAWREACMPMLTLLSLSSQHLDKDCGTAASGVTARGPLNGMEA